VKAAVPPHGSPFFGARQLRRCSSSRFGVLGCQRFEIGPHRGGRGAGAEPEKIPEIGKLTGAAAARCHGSAARIVCPREGSRSANHQDRTIDDHPRSSESSRSSVRLPACANAAAPGSLRYEPTSTESGSRPRNGPLGRSSRVASSFPGGGSG